MLGRRASVGLLAVFGLAAICYGADRSIGACRTEREPERMKPRTEGSNDAGNT